MPDYTDPNDLLKPDPDREWFTAPRYTVTLNYTEMELLLMALSTYNSEMGVPAHDPIAEDLRVGTLAEATELRARLVNIAGHDLEQG